MDLGIFRVPVLSWLFRQVKAIPITSAKSDPQIVERAFERVSAALRAGQLVCIFPEGGITSDGEIGGFRPGISRILSATTRCRSCRSPCRGCGARSSRAATGRR